MDGSNHDGNIIIMRTQTSAARAGITNRPRGAETRSTTGVDRETQRSAAYAKTAAIKRYATITGQKVVLAEQLPTRFQILIGDRERMDCRVEWRGDNHVVISVCGKLITLGAMQRVVCTEVTP